HFFKEGITRSMLTPAGPDHAQIGATSGILDYLDAVYEHHFSEEATPAERNLALTQLFRSTEKALMEPLLKFLRSRQDVKILGLRQTEGRVPTISILPLTKSIEEVYAALTKHQLMLGTGDFYAARPLMDMGIPLDPGVLRMSFLHYTNMEEIDQLIEGLQVALEAY
ncbi:aminotransferase class V-fold PLP-dependent enzyme, partial [uncultured Eudoraea sp.]|uniref:aminotransferase class V-fold PLP-dependent enzyme n=1 Tax=uncultured Eudoraea sp. TaxID=1035614 RepID=UPI00261B3823